jgi:hypothetical protein
MLLVLPLTLCFGAGAFGQMAADAIETQVQAAARQRPQVEATLLERWSSAARERGVNEDSWQARMTRQLRRASARQLAAAMNAETYEDFLKVATGATSAERLLRGGAEATETVFGDPNSNLTYTPIVPCRIVDTRRSGTPGEVGIVNVGQRRQWDARGFFDFSFQGGDVSCPELEAVNPRAFALVVTATGYANSGSLKLFEAGAGAPFGAALTYYKGVQKTVANGLIVRSCTTCGDQIEARAFTAGTHVAIDVLGFFQSAEFPDPPEPPEVPLLFPVGPAFNGPCASTSITPGTTQGLLTPACPAGSIIVGGSCSLPPDVSLVTSALFGDRWNCSARNLTSGSRLLTGCSVCLSRPLTDIPTL